jgi:hypothetical protein
LHVRKTIRGYGITDVEGGNLPSAALTTNGSSAQEAEFAKFWAFPNSRLSR